MQDTMELIAKTEEGKTLLLAPGVGRFTCALERGQLLGPGQDAGVLLVTGRTRYLKVPAGVRGRIVNPRPERVYEPVGYHNVLYELAPLSAEGADDEQGTAQAESEFGLVLRSPQTGRFYRRPSPDEPPFVEEGQEITEGAPVGLIEVMKTFTTVNYRAEAGLPARAKVVRLLLEDGAEVAEGDPVLAVE